MALKKDEICVWLSQHRSQTQISFSLLSCPKNRCKEIEARLQTAASKKIKGNRLDSLDFDRLDPASLAHCEEVLNTLFRISDLSGFASVFYPKTSRLEADVYSAAGQCLKERYPGCSFVIYSDPKQIRSSTLQNWKKKLQLQAVFEPLSLSDSVMIQCAALSGAALFSLLDDPVHQQAQAKAVRLAGMARAWRVVEPAVLYASQYPQLDTPAFFRVLETLPELLSQGILEKWLRKGLPEKYFSFLETLLESRLDRSILLETAPARLQAQAQTLLERADSADQPFPEEQFAAWRDSIVQSLHELPGLERFKTGTSWADHSDCLSQTLRSLLEDWIENPSLGSERLKDSVYVLDEGEQILMLKTALMPWLEGRLTDPSDWPDSLKPERMPAAVLEERLKDLSALRPIPSCYVPDSMLERLRIRSVETDCFLPLYPMRDESVLVMNRLAEQAGQASRASLTGKPASWFPESVEKTLSESDRMLLAYSDLDIQQTRLLARALARGLSRDKAVRTLSRPQGSVFSLVRPYLYSRKVQAFLARIHDPNLLRLLNRPSLRLSQMEAISELAAQGFPLDWLAVNLKENATLKGIRTLESLFPGGRIPPAWQFCRPIPDELTQWLILAAGRKHPGKEESQLRDSLIEFNTALADLLFQSEALRTVLNRQTEEQDPSALPHSAQNQDQA